MVFSINTKIFYVSHAINKNLIKFQINNKIILHSHKQNYQRKRKIMKFLLPKYIMRKVQYLKLIIWRYVVQMKI